MAMDIKFAGLLYGGRWDSFLHPSLYFHNGNDYLLSCQFNLTRQPDSVYIEKFFCVCKNRNKNNGYLVLWNADIIVTRIYSCMHAHRLLP